MEGVNEVVTVLRKKYEKPVIHQVLANGYQLIPHRPAIEKPGRITTA
ncbi:hypothetical protein JAO74_14940 [Sphingomonas sp. BT553]|uniref:OmpR/PhoB-type domain-containing protein n=2 Tax=Sphingomonas mollis TaxID=2795726 RepID=A0ABS0XSS8_9SPHN|nr:hypothetical protein [Sphingomonas sp. BT553]